MQKLPVALLPFCLWLVKLSHGNSSLGSGFSELHTEFAVSLYQTLTETENNSNLIVSPASVSLSLGLLELGAKGETLSQLERTLGYNAKDAGVQDVFSGLHGHMGNSTHGVQLRLANALFIQSGVHLHPDFTQHASAWGNSSLISMNFSHPNHTHSQLQQWTRYHSNADDARVRQTGKELLGSGESQDETSSWGSLPRMALVSTLVFQGAWQKQFLFTETQNLPFTLSDGSTIKVPMMYQSTEVNFGQFHMHSEQRYTVLELPYLSRSLSLLLALPSDRKTPLSHLESQLSAHVVGLWDTGLRRTKMDVFLPRFKMRGKFNLKPVLQSLGVSHAFDPSAADFRGISEEEGLYVSEAVHETMIEVTEEGTKAAAATAMVLLKRSRAPVFKADRPFLFLLRQISTGSILFIGRVLNPAEQPA